MTLSQLEVTGAEVYAVTIGNELSKRGHNVICASDTLSKPILGKYIPIAFNKRLPQQRLWHVLKLIWIIKRENIQIVHAHSRAAGWVSFVACKLSKTPMITTVHGRQPVHASRKFFPAFGYAAIAVAEDIKDQIVACLGIPQDKVVVLRNAIDTNKFRYSPPANSVLRPIVSIIGRLTGPKGDLCYELLEKTLADLITNNKIEIRITTSSTLPERFIKYKKFIRNLNASQDIHEEIKASNLIIGAGRVAIEALLTGRPVFAIGEAKSIGIITLSNIDEALKTNFGDIGPRELQINFGEVKKQVEGFIGSLGHKHASADAEVYSENAALRSRLEPEFNLTTIVNKLENIYQTAVVDTLRREMPILMYHRLISHESEKGIHGTWIYEDRFEKHLKLIKRLGYKTLTFHDFEQKGFIHRLEYGRKYLMITADDGYRDNLTRMLPLLEKYDMKAVIFIVSNETHNRWDTESTSDPDVRADLLSAKEIKSLVASGRVEIGGHTLSHPRLDELSPEAQRREIGENKAQLENTTGQPVISFAYPYGNINENAKSEVISAGYRFAVATDSGPRQMHTDPFQIRRIAVFPRTSTFGLWRKIRGNYVWGR